MPSRATTTITTTLRELGLRYFGAAAGAAGVAAGAASVGGGGVTFSAASVSSGRGGTGGMTVDSARCRGRSRSGGGRMALAPLFAYGGTQRQQQQPAQETDCQPAAQGEYIVEASHVGFAAGGLCQLRAALGTAQHRVGDLRCVQLLLDAQALCHHRVGWIELAGQRAGIQL